jgi:signal transduction histidine kinase
VLADEDRLQQVLSNLVDNALKYGAAGGRVLLRAAVESDRVRIAVVDWGPGVPPSEAAQVFDRFYRLDPDQQGGVAGAGLGLYICRELVRQMGGEIWVEPTPGGGATFVVDLAVARERVDVKLGRAVAASDAAQARHVRP